MTGYGKRPLEEGAFSQSAESLVLVDFLYGFEPRNPPENVHLDYRYARHAFETTPHYSAAL
jgi:hypothetical protein